MMSGRSLVSGPFEEDGRPSVAFFKAFFILRSETFELHVR